MRFFIRKKVFAHLFAPGALALAQSVLLTSPSAYGGPIYSLTFQYANQAADPASGGGFSGSFNKTLNWNQSGSTGFSESELGASVAATIAGTTSGQLNLSGSLQADSDEIAATLQGKLAIGSLSSPGAGVLRLSTNYEPSQTSFQTAAGTVSVSSNLSLTLINGIGASASVGLDGASESFSSNLSSSGSVLAPNLGTEKFSTQVLSYNQGGNGLISVFGSSPKPLPGNGLVSVPTGIPGLGIKVNVNPSITTQASSLGSGMAAAKGSNADIAQISLSTNNAEQFSFLPFSPLLTGTLASVIPNPNSSNPIEEGAYKAAEALLSNVGYDLFETQLAEKIGVQAQYQLAPSQELNYSFYVLQTGQTISGNTNTGYVDLKTDGLSQLTIVPTVTLVDPVLYNQAYLTINPVIGAQALEANGFGHTLGPLFNELYTPGSLSIEVSSGQEYLTGDETEQLAPFTIDVPGSEPVPEPLTWVLIGSGLVCIGKFRRGKRH